MIIAISYKEGQIYEHFGHAEMFALYEFNMSEPENVTKRLLEVKDAHGHKAMADLMKANNVDLVLSGHMGAEAKNQLLAYGIIPVAGYCGDADTAADMLIAGTLPLVPEDAGACSGGCGGCGGSCGCGDEGEDGGCGCGGGCCH